MPRLADLTQSALISASSTCSRSRRRTSRRSWGCWDTCVARWGRRRAATACPPYRPHALQLRLWLAR